MLKFILKRILIMIPTLFAVVFIVFSIMSFTPGTPADIILRDGATLEAIARLNHELGADRPFVIRFFSYILQICQGDLGESYHTGRSVLQDILYRLPATLSLAGYAMIVAVIIGIPLGILAAVKQYSIFEFISTSVSMFFVSMPTFWLGLILIWIFALKLHVLPSNGNSTWIHYILPVMTCALGEAAVLLRITRTTMLEAIRQDYIRTARAKGQLENIVIRRHALKNALLPVITVIGMDFGFLLGGVVATEAVFSFSGIGSLTLTAIRMKDEPMVTGCVLVLSVIFMLVMLLVDILYAYIDPRIKARYKIENA